MNYSSPIEWNNPLNRDLLVWLKAVNQWRGNTWHDLTNRFPATLTNGALYEGGAVRVDGVNDYVGVPMTSPNLSGGFTIIVRVWGDIAVPVTGASQGVFNYGGSNENIGCSWSHTSSAYSGSCWMKGNGSYPVVLWTTKPPAKTWVDIGMTWTSAGSLTAYVNGISQGSTTNTTFGTAADPTFFLGQNISSSPWPGKVSSIQIFKRALAPTEMLLHNKLSQQDYKGLIKKPRVAFVGTPVTGVIGTAASDLKSVTSSGTGSYSLVGTASSLVYSVVSAANATYSMIATGASTLASILSSGTGTYTLNAVASSTLSSVVSLGTGTYSLTGAGDSSLGGVLSSGTGTYTVVGTSSSALQSVLSSGTGTYTLLSTGGSVLKAVTSSGLGTYSLVGTGNSMLHSITSSGTTGDAPILASFSDTLTFAETIRMQVRNPSRLQLLGDIEEPGDTFDELVFEDSMSVDVEYAPPGSIGDELILNDVIRKEIRRGN